MRREKAEKMGGMAEAERGFGVCTHPASLHLVEMTGVL